MLGTFWHAVFFDPIYNCLVFFIDIVPGGDVGIAIVLTTVVVKVILLPLSLKAARMQYIQRELEPRLKEIQKKYKGKREELARATMEVYKNAGVNPFSSIFLLFIQIPIIIALYWSVSRGGGVPFPDINIELLYSFVPTPEAASTLFFGMVDIVERNLPLALLAGITQFIHSSLALPKPKPREKNAEPNFKEDFARSMQLQMRYMMPIIIGVVAYTINAAIALYFVVSNVLQIGQEYIVRYKGLKHDPHNPS